MMLTNRVMLVFYHNNKPFVPAELCHSMIQYLAEHPFPRQQYLTEDEFIELMESSEPLILDQNLCAELIIYIKKYVEWCCL